jgi:hypothetical protein
LIFIIQFSSIKRESQRKIKKMKLYAAFFLLATVVLAVQAKALGVDKEQEHGKRVVRDLFSFEDSRSVSDEIKYEIYRQHLAQQAQNAQQGPSQVPSQGPQVNQGPRYRRDLFDFEASEEDKHAVSAPF